MMICIGWSVKIASAMFVVVVFVGGALLHFCGVIVSILAIKLKIKLWRHCYFLLDPFQSEMLQGRYIFLLEFLWPGLWLSWKRKLNAVVSSVSYTTAGVSQGTVLSSVLFIVYSDDCRGSDECPVVKFSDGTAITDLSNSHQSITDFVHRFSEWWSDNHLNALKTREMIIDFRRNSAVLPKFSITSTEVDRMEEHRYFGIHSVFSSSGHLCR